MAEKETTESDALSMFFNDDFVPHAYLDALFDNTLSGASRRQPGVRSRLDSIENLQVLQSQCSGLLAHLDYYSKELTNDLEDRILKLHASSTVISFDDGAQDDEGSTTRLDFYVENLINCINSLQDDIKLYNVQILRLESSEEDKQVLTTLTSLKLAKSRILQVLKIFDTAKLVATTAELEDVEEVVKPGVAPTSNKTTQQVNIDSETFNKSLYLLEGAIDEELKLHDIDDKVIVSKIDNLIRLLPLFKRLPNFYPNYASFVDRITLKKSNILS